MKRKHLLWTSLTITVALLIGQIVWVWWFMGWAIGLAIAAFLQGIYLFKDWHVEPVLTVLLALGVVMLLVGVVILGPSLTAVQVKEMVSAFYGGDLAGSFELPAMSAQYKWNGQWEVRYWNFMRQVWEYALVDEQSGRILDFYYK